MRATFALCFALYTWTDFALSYFAVNTFAASIMIGGRSELLTALGSYSQADEDRSSPICCPRPQTINRNCGSIDRGRNLLKSRHRDRWWQTGYDNRDDRCR